MVETAPLLNRSGLLNIAPFRDNPTPPGLSLAVKDALDKIGTKCTNIINNTPTTSTKLATLLQIEHYDLEKVTENLYRPKIGSFAMKVTKYLAENFNLQIVTFQKTPGVLDSSNNRLPQDYHLVIVLQGLGVEQAPTETIESEYSALLEYISSKTDVLTPPAGWIPTYSLKPIVGASVVLGVALTMLLKK